MSEKSIFALFSDEISRGEAKMVKVNFDAIVKNATFLKDKIGKAKLCAVVKCDAYGHGLERTARHLTDIADFFAVATVAEANAVAYLKKDVLILLPLDDVDTLCALESGYCLTVDGFDTLRRVMRAAERCKKTARIHLKCDTGMSRLGFFRSDLPEVRRMLQDADCRIEGVYSHFSVADSDRLFTEKQFEEFLRIKAYVTENIASDCLFHIANTAAVFADEKYCLDMVRVGLGLYGYGGKGLIPAKSVYAEVLSVKEVQKGSYVGYGNAYRCERDSKIALVSVGYASGLPRVLSGRLRFKIGDKTVPSVGNICMGMTAADVTGVEVKPFDKVLIIGEDNVFADTEDVIVYELLCNLK